MSLSLLAPLVLQMPLVPCMCSGTGGFEVELKVQRRQATGVISAERPGLPLAGGPPSGRLAYHVDSWAQRFHTLHA